MTEPTETRIARVTTNLVPTVLERLDAYRYDRRWSRSTAIAVLVEKGLEAVEAEDRKARGRRS